MATRSTVSISAASLAIGIAAGLGIGKMAFSPEPTPDAFAVRCVSVYDGDTISVNYRGNVEKVRLLGIECVEMKKGKKLAAQAQEYRVDEKVISRSSVRARPLAFSVAPPKGRTAGLAGLRQFA